MNLINSTNFLFIFDSIDLNSKLKKLEFIYHFHYGKKRPKKKKNPSCNFTSRETRNKKANLDFAT